MDDKELLTLAAKAAGILGKFNRTVGAIRVLPGQKTPYGMAYNYWNPFLDDGEAFRLAADLDLFGSPSYWHYLALARLHNSIDKYENVRRAIVRAAAEIGRWM